MALSLAAHVCLLVGGGDAAAWRWHARFGHLHFRALHDLGAKVMVPGMPAIQHLEQFCEGCTLGKMHRTTFPPPTTYYAQQGLELVHGDLCGPITPATMRGNKFFLLLLMTSRYMWLEVLRSKDWAFRFFKKIKAPVEMQSGAKLRAFRTDCGGEFNSNEFTAYCEELGIQRNTTTPYTPQQNSVIELRNQSVVEMACSLMKSMGVPSASWGEAVRTVVHIFNRSPTRSLQGVTPYEVWCKKKPGADYFRMFGCVAHVKIVGPGVNKLSGRSVPGVFLGYEPGTKGYRVYDPIGRRL